jgi:sec-independent protein translocase protein TatA
MHIPQSSQFAVLDGPVIFAVLAVVVVLFGGKKIPEMAKGLGEGIKGFKDAMKEDDHKPTVPPAEVPKTETTKQV